MTFSALNYIELLQELQKFRDCTEFGDYRLDNSLLIRNNNYKIKIFFEDRLAIERYVFSIIYNPTPYNTNIASDNYIYDPEGGDIGLFFDTNYKFEKIQYCDIDSIGGVEFQMSTTMEFSNIFTFLCYLISTKYEFGIYGSYNKDPKTLHYILKLLKDKNESIT